MKKCIFILLVLSIVTLQPMLCASLEPVFTLSPSFSYSTTKVTSYVDESEAVSCYKLYAEQSPLLALGFKLSTTYLDIVGIINLHQKLFLLSDNDGYLWFQPKASLSIDDNSPRIGYAETRYKGLLCSIGRRPLKWGPGFYDLGISDNAPYYDGLWLQYRFDESYGSWWYQFLASNFGGMYCTTNSPINKGLFAHRVGFENRFVRATVSELAMSWSDTAAFLNWIPFGVWQSTAHATSNVMIEATCEGLAGPARFYGSFISSDSVIIGSLEENPAAFGAMLGFEWHFFDGTLLSGQSDYALRENTFHPLQGGLIAGLECYYTSNYLYCSNAKEGTFTAPLKQFSYAGALYGDSIAYYLGLPYGPGSFLTQAIVTYEGHSFKLSGILGVLLKSEASAATLYSEGTLDGFSLQDSDIHLLCTCKGAWRFNRFLQLTGLLREDFNINDKTSDFLVSIGASLEWMPTFDIR